MAGEDSFSNRRFKKGLNTLLEERLWTQITTAIL